MKSNPLDILTFILFLFITILILFAIVNFLIYSNTPFNKNFYENISLENNSFNSENNKLSESSNNITSVTISAIGDIMCHNTLFKDAYTSNGNYDFSNFFVDVKDYISTSDIAIGNLETTFAGEKKKYSGYPSFNTPEALAYNLKDIGIDVLTTANNHSLDTGYLGIENTINFLNDAGISHTGTAISQNEQNSILIKEINGIKLAFLAYTYGTNGNIIPKR